jgi:mannose-6-phosphate isomerase-like protein (cupin superfamily)
MSHHAFIASEGQSPNTSPRAIIRAVFPDVPASLLADFERFLTATIAEMAAHAVTIFEKPYGRNHILALNERFGLSCAVFEPSCETSFHYHEERREFYWVRNGELDLLRPEGVTILTAGDHSHSEPGQRHRLRNRGRLRLEVLEIFSPPLLDDKVRIEDRYGRTLGQVHRNE